MKTFLSSMVSSRYFRLCAGLVISALFLYLALRNVDFDEVWQALLETQLGWLGLSLLVVLANNLAKAVRWRVLMGDKGGKVHLAKIFVSHLSGQTLNILFPARLGDLSRAYFVGGLGPGRVFVLGTVILEKIPDLIAYVALTLCLLLLMPLPDWISHSGYTVALVMLVVFLAILLVIVWRDRVLRLLDRLLARLPESLHVSVLDHVDAGLSSLEVLQNRGGLVRLVFWTVFIWGTAVGVNQLVLLALGIHLPWTASLLTLVALQAGVVLPSVPGRIGVFEYICIMILAIFGIGHAQALSYGILLHAVVFLPMVFLGLPFLGFLELDDEQLSQHGDSKGSRL